MVRFTDKYTQELNMFFNTTRASVITVCVDYLRSVIEVILVLVLSYFKFGVISESIDFKMILVNIFACYATVSMCLNSFLSCVMHVGGGNELNAFVPLITSGVAKIQIFHPHSIYRNCVTRPIVAAFFYTIAIVLDIVSMNPPSAEKVITKKLVFTLFNASLLINLTFGLLKTIVWHRLIKKEPIFNVESIVDFEHPSTVEPTDETPEDDNRDYEPPKVENQFTCSV